MANISRPGRSGGKILRARETAGARTPYDRPTPRLLHGPAPENPNWLSRLILSPSRSIVSGAGKVLSSVFGAESSASSSSSSEVDSISDDEMDNANDDDDVSSESARRIGTEMVAAKETSEMNSFQPIEWKCETKRVIEQMLMKETFTREECDRLIHVIKSRVVEAPNAVSTENGRLIGTPDKSVRTGTVVTEAKKWIKEKRLGSNSKSDLVYGTSLDNALLPLVTEGEAGSPVDLAKTYMRGRPPWASPSANPVLSNSLTSPKLNMHSPATGSWNILEELRKVRSKATEEMLRNRPSSKIDWTALASDYRGSSNLFTADKPEAVIKDGTDNSTHLVDAPLNRENAAPAHGLTDPQKAQKGLHEKAFQPNSTASVTEQTRDTGAIPINGAEATLKFKVLQPLEVSEATLQCAITGNVETDADDNRQPVSSVVAGDTQESRLSVINCSTSMEDAVKDGVVATNGFPSSGSSLPAGQEREHEAKKPPGSVDHKHESNPPELPGEILPEVDVEVPNTNENDNTVVATGSQDSLTMPHKEDTSPPIPKRGLARGMDDATEKQQGRQASRYNRRGRSRGK